MYNFNSCSLFKIAVARRFVHKKRRVLYMGKKNTFWAELREDSHRIDVKSVVSFCVVLALVAIAMCVINIMEESWRMAVVTGGMAVWIAVTLLIWWIMKNMV